jgi:lycopene cyclase domain-containing protein
MYTVWALVAAAAAVVVELVWARTGLFRRPAYWVTIAITWLFQIPVDGWLTKLSAPIVIYNPKEFSGDRFPWDIPLEDFAYGFALVTVVLILWLRAAGPASRRVAAIPAPRGAADDSQESRRH